VIALLLSLSYGTGVKPWWTNGRSEEVAIALRRATAETSEMLISAIAIKTASNFASSFSVGVIFDICPPVRYKRRQGITPSREEPICDSGLHLVSARKESQTPTRVQRFFLVYELRTEWEDQLLHR